MNQNAMGKKPFIMPARFALLLLLVPAAVRAGAPQDYFPLEEYWQQQADYELNITLDTGSKMLTGTGTITYTNNSPDTLDEFYMHLYPNAYRKKNSPLYRDYLQGTGLFLVGLPKANRGWLDVTELSVNGSPVEFTVDYTILECAFPTPLPPGETATIAFSFIEKIRKRMGRAGYQGEHFDLAQWYPKMVVYDKMGWHPDQFRIGEFYGEFGTFDVHITLPEKYVIAATGVPVSGDPGWERNKAWVDGKPATGGSDAAAGAKTVHFRAEKVHDFAFSADPDYVVESADRNGYKVMCFYRAWNRAWEDSVLARTIRSLDWLEEVVGPYPYPQVTVADCPTHGGMEYPMLAMNGSPEESLILHEVAHNYFQGALANDEREEAWLDEGFVQYMVFWRNAVRMGPHAAAKMWDGLADPIIKNKRIGFDERISTPSHEFENNYHLTVYIKSALFLRALHYAVGDETFREILKNYYERWKFKHVDEAAFRSIVEEATDVDLKEQFKQWLHTTKNTDYRLGKFEVTESGGKFKTDIRIDRKDDLYIPLDVVFRFRDGNTASERIPGLLRTIEKEFTFDQEPVSVAINPKNEIMDVFQIDNFSPRKRDLAWDNPFDEKRPQDAFQYRLTPSGYYNDIDGGLAGLRLRSGYAGMYRLFTLQGFYGFESEKVHVFGSFENPISYFGRDSKYRLEGYHREGRQGISLAIDKIFRKSLNDPLAKYLSVWLEYEELTDPAYVYPYTYDDGVNVWAGFRFSIEPKSDVYATSFSYALDRSIWGSDYRFEKSTVEFKLWPARRYPIPLELKLRFFLGFSSIDPSLQQMYNLAGAGVLEKENYFWLRSVGAWPKDYYSNFHVAGDANMRGYYGGDYSFRRVFSNNMELDFPLGRLKKQSIGKRKFESRLYLFFDWGKVLDSKPYENLPPDFAPSLGEGYFGNVFSDFGASIQVWRIVAEFPIYVSHPALTGESEQWDFRWTIGINSLF